jgi:hypothetical protein
VDAFDAEVRQRNLIKLVSSKGRSEN